MRLMYDGATFHTPLWAVCLYYVRVNICHQLDRHMYQPGFEPATSRLLSEYAIHYTTAVVLLYNFSNLKGIAQYLMAMKFWN